MGTSNMDQENTFEYTYSAQRQEEVEAIKKKYLPNEDMMEQLRKLDRSVETQGTMCAIMIGVIGTLVFGTGMSLAMVWAKTFFVLGIICGIIGMALIATAYPVYKLVIKKQRKKVAPQILALSEELLK